MSQDMPEISGEAQYIAKHYLAQYVHCESNAQKVLDEAKKHNVRIGKKLDGGYEAWYEFGPVQA